MTFAAACGGNSMMSPSGTTATMAGTWAGSASDSSVSMGAGSVMGQTGMGMMTWPLTQVGSTVTGSMSFSGMQGRMHRSTMTMTGTYAGSNSCTGTFTNGQMTMTRQ